MTEVDTSTVASSSQLEAVRVRMSAGQGVPWQRCAVADRMIVVIEGAGYAYRTRGRDDVRDEVGPGDVVHAQRMVWHRLVAAPDQALTAILVAHVPADVEYRR